jgi:putative PIN family toxin of toxin-antitoxin system
VRVVLDTNVLVSGLLTPLGPPGRIVDLVLAGHVTLVVDDRVLAEYSDVRRRSRFGFNPGDVSALLEFLAAEAERVIPPPLAVALPDADDLPFLEVAATAAVSLVTGNPRHFRPTRGSHQVELLAPAEVLGRLAAGLMVGIGRSRAQLGPFQRVSRAAGSPADPLPLVVVASG